MKQFFRWVFIMTALIILVSPLVYWSTGLGQTAKDLSPRLIRQADGLPVSSPKAEALHTLSLPLRIQGLCLFPLLLLSFQLSGGALALRVWLEKKTGGRRDVAELQVNTTSWLARLWVRVSDQLLITLLFVLTFNLALELLYLPLDFYRGFIMGHQFGLSTQSMAGWGIDWLKTLVISLLFTTLAWSGLYSLMRLWPRRWPIPAGGILLVLSGALVLLIPIFITPLFYQVYPLQDANLRARIIALAGQAGMHVEAVEVIDASAKTTQVNAYFTGFGGAQRIVLYDTLLRDYTPDQIEVVLAHEMGHWYYQHMLWTVLGVGLVGWLGLFLLKWTLEYSWPWLGLAGPADIAGLPYVLAVVAIGSTLLMPAENGLSRWAENQADRFALKTSQKPAAMVQLWEQFAGQNLAVVNPPLWEKLLFYTHPPLAERIHLAEGWAEPQ